MWSRLFFKIFMYYLAVLGLCTWSCLFGFFFNIYLLFGCVGLSCDTQDLRYFRQDLSLHGRFRCPEECGILVPWPGIKLTSPASQKADSYLLDHQGTPCGVVSLASLGLFFSFPGTVGLTHAKTSMFPSSVQFSRSVVSDSLPPHESQHTRPSCPSPSPGVHSDSCPSSQWCHPAISSSVISFSSCPQSLLANRVTLGSPVSQWAQCPLYQGSELRTFHTPASSTVSTLGSDLMPTSPARREKMNNGQSSSVIIIWKVSVRNKWDKTSRWDTGMSPEGSITFISGGIVKTPPPLAHPASQTPLLRRLLPLRHLSHDLSSSPTHWVPLKRYIPPKRDIRKS